MDEVKVIMNNPSKKKKKKKERKKEIGFFREAFKNLTLFTFPPPQAACNKLEAYISTLTHSIKDEIHITQLHGASVFKGVRIGIFGVLGKKRILAFIFSVALFC